MLLLVASSVGLLGCAARPLDHGPRPLVVTTIALPGGATGLDADVGGARGLFLLDTGGGVTTLTPAAAKLSGCHPWGGITGFRANGERLDTKRCDDLRLTVAGRTFVAPIASVLDLQSLAGPAMPILSGLIALDLFAGDAITIRPLAHELVVETGSSLQERVAGAVEVPVRPVRDVEGVALTVDVAVDTPAGHAWMELDNGNLGPLMIGQPVALLLGLDAARRLRQPASFKIAGGIPVEGPARVGRFIMDGDIGESVLGRFDVTFDLARGRAWFRPADAAASPRRDPT